jgi:hypothetical protein
MDPVEAQPDLVGLRQQSIVTFSMKCTARSNVHISSDVDCDSKKRSTQEKSGNDTKRSQIQVTTKADFLRVMKWVVPILLTIAVAFYIYMLTYLAGPVKENQTVIKQLHIEIERLREDKLRRNPDKQSENEAPQQVPIIMIITIIPEKPPIQDSTLTKAAN